MKSSCGRGQRTVRSCSRGGRTSNRDVTTRPPKLNASTSSAPIMPGTDRDFLGSAA